MERPKRQTRKPGKYDEEFIIPEEAAEMYWEANTRKVYRFLTDKDVKSSLKHSTVYILWPGDGKWYLAEVEELDVPERTAKLRYPETSEEEEVDLQELIQGKCIAVVEHLPRATKLQKGCEVPCTDADAEGVEYESGDEAGVEETEQQQQQQGTPRQASTRRPRAPADDDYDAEQDSDAVPMSDDENLDSDAHVSDDQAPSGSDGESLAAPADKTGSRQDKHSSTGGVLASKQHRGSKLNTPSKGNNKPSRTGAAAGGIGPVAAPGLLPMMSGASTAAAGTGSMLFVPMGATGTASAAGHSAGNGSLWSYGSRDMMDLQQQLQQQPVMLRKRRTSEGAGMPGSEAKRRAAAAAAAAGRDPAGNDAFKKAMLEKLLAKRQQASGPGTGGPAAAAAAGGSARVSTPRLARGASGTERRLSGSGSANLQRASSDVDVRQKAAVQLAVGLKKAVEEAQGKCKAQQHKQHKQQVEDMLQQHEGVEQQDSDTIAAAVAGTVTQQQSEQHEQPSGECRQAAALATEAAGQAVGGVAAESAEQQGRQLQQSQQQQQEQQQDLPNMQLPDPQKLATAIEQQLYDLCGSVNAEYKSRMRRLVFNLRDPQNPDLRGHVLTGDILPQQLVRMTAADLANKDLAEWRRKIEEEHNKAIELDLETAAKYSTAAAWATREDRLRRTEMALLGTLAVEGNAKRSTPEPPPAAAGSSKGDRAAKRNRHNRESGAIAVSDSREGQSVSGTEGDRTLEEAGTPTRPASDGGNGLTADAGWGPSSGSCHMMAAAAVGDDGTEAHWQHSQQIISPTGADHTAASDPGLLSTPSLSQGCIPAGSAAGSAVGAGLQQVESVTSKAPPAASGIFAGIDWAAIKKDAVKASKEQQQQPQQQQLEDTAAAAAAAPPPIDDAPYNPDDDDDEQPYNPTESNEHDSASHGTPTAAAGTPAAATAAAAVPASSARPGHTEALDPGLPDMLPVIVAPRSSKSSTTGQNWPAPGEAVWRGRFLVPAAGSFTACVQQVAGLGEVGLMLGPAGAAVEVIGRVALDKFAAFAEELRKSRSRTISLGLVGCAAGADAVDAAYMHELLQSYSSKGRIGKLGLARDVEGYLVAKSDLTARLLKTATLVTPPSQQHLVPRDVASNQFLLLIVHRKDFIPPKPLQLPPPAPPQEQQIPVAGGSDDAAKLDPRRRAATIAAAAPQQQLPPGAVASAPSGAAGPGGSTLSPGPPSQGAMPPGVLPPPPPPAPAPAAGPSPAASVPGPPEAVAAVGAGSVPSAMPGLDLTSLSALAVALGLPGGPPQSSAAPSAAGDAAALLSAAAAGGGQPGVEQSTYQPQTLAGAGLPGPPPPPRSSSAAGPGQQSFSPSQGPASTGEPTGLLSALQQAAAPAGDFTSQQQQQQQYTVDMRSLHPPGGPDQSLVYDLRQAQQQHQQQQQPAPADFPAVGPPPGSAGGAPVIILPPGAPVPAPGSMSIPDGAVFMTQDSVTGALVPVGPPPPPPQHMMQQPMQPFPGPPPPGYGGFEGQMGYPGPFGVEGPDGFGGGMQPPPHTAPPPPSGGPRGPAGGGPRPMMRRY